MAVKLTLGPVLFNWTPDKWRDFYFKIAAEAPVDIVYVGEVVCSKRLPFFADILPDVVERLAQGPATMSELAAPYDMTLTAAGDVVPLAERQRVLLRGTGVQACPAAPGFNPNRLMISACTARVCSLPTSTGLRTVLPDDGPLALEE